MGQTIIAKGRNIDEAINVGLKILKSAQDDVLIEIIQKETKGILGIGFKPAIVKLTKIQDQKERKDSAENVEDIIEDLLLNSHYSSIESNEKEESEKLKIESNAKEESEKLKIQEPLSQDDLEGKVWVENGKIFCKSSPLHYPTITIGKGVQLFKNNELVTGTTVVTETDQFEIKVKEEIIETKWNITIDQEKLNVVLHVEPGMKKSFVIKDIAPDYHIELNAEEHVEIRNDLEYKQILQELEALNVTRGFDFVEIRNAVNTNKAGSFVIATGVKPKEGKNGWVELKVNIDSQQTGPKLREDGTVDF